MVLTVDVVDFSGFAEFQVFWTILRRLLDVDVQFSVFGGPFLEARSGRSCVQYSTLIPFLRIL